jgi:hypothetical protein
MARKQNHAYISTKIALNSSIFDQYWNEGCQTNRLDEAILIVHEDSFTGEEVIKVSLVLGECTVHGVEKGATN